MAQDNLAADFVRIKNLAARLPLRTNEFFLRRKTPAKIFFLYNHSAPSLPPHPRRPAPAVYFGFGSPRLETNGQGFLAAEFSRRIAGDGQTGTDADKFSRRFTELLDQIKIRRNAKRSELLLQNSPLNRDRQTGKIVGDDVRRL